MLSDRFNLVYPKNDNLNGHYADDVDEVINRYQDHPSITKINEQRPLGDVFNFKDITIEVIAKGIANLKTNCSAGWDTVSSKILRPCFNECSSFLAKCFNSYKNSGTFPDELKLANIVPVPKKCGLTLKKNYKPVSVLPVVSKLFECLILNQLDSYFSDKLSHILGGYKKGFSWQDSLIRLIEKWRRCLDSKGIVGSILIDL